ncbi:MAG: hypothetical protein II920_10635, partial [Clostridia bacterium]|nr:hypothetical protein [Clostridia bacterium]
ALLLSLCLLVGTTAAMAQGVNIHVTANVMDEEPTDVTVQILQDEDGCYQLYVNGEAQGDALNAFAQIGQSAITIGSEGQYAKIDYETLLAALKNALLNNLTEEEKTLLGIIVYIFTGLEGDMEIFSGVLENELNRMVNLAMTQSIMTMTNDGVVIELDEKQLVSFVKAYLTALAEDGSVFETLAGTELFKLLGVEAAAAQQAVAEFAAEIDPDDIDEDVSLHIKATIYKDGRIDAEMQYANDDGAFEATVNYDGQSVKAYVNIEDDDMTLTEEITFDGKNLDMTMTMKSEEGIDISAVAHNVYDGYTIEGTETITGTIDMDGEVINIDGTSEVRYDFGNLEFAANADLKATEGAETLAAITYNFAYDAQNGLDLSAEVEAMGEKYGGYLQAYCGENEYGYVANGHLDIVYKGEEYRDIIAFDAVISDVITVKAAINDLRIYDLYDEFGDSVYLETISLFGEGDFDLYTKEEYEAIKDTLVSGLVEMLAFDLTVDTNTAAFECTLSAEDTAIMLSGSASESAYTIDVYLNNTKFASFEQELLPNQSLLNSLLLGKQTLTIVDGTVITRTTEMKEDGLAWTFTYTDAVGDSTVYVVGLRMIPEKDGSTHIELYVISDGTEIDLGLKYLETQTAINAELYVNMVNGGYTVNYADIVIDVTMTDETGAHVDAPALDQDTLEQMLTPVIAEILDR